MTPAIFMCVSLSILGLSSVVLPVVARTQLQPSCRGKCNAGRVWTCFCNAHCQRHGDCCHDYVAMCTSHRATNVAKPRKVAKPQQRTFTSRHYNASLSDVVSALWRSDANRLPPSELKLNFQAKTSSREHRDKSYRPLFQRVGRTYMGRQTYKLFLRLLDNYNPDVLVPEIQTSSERHENEAFLNAILETGPMSVLRKYLLARGDINNARDSLKNLLKRLWFDLYPRKSRGAVSSSGFEHVMVGELKKQEITGFHNWIQMYNEELQGRLNYHGYVFKDEPYVIGTRFTWKGGNKQLGSMFVGVSPEFDLAIYTLCMVVHPNGMCNFRLNRKNVSIRTYDMRHVPGLQVATAFIVKVS